MSGQVRKSKRHWLWRVAWCHPLFLLCPLTVKGRAPAGTIMPPLLSTTTIASCTVYVSPTRTSQSLGSLAASVKLWISVFKNLPGIQGSITFSGVWILDLALNGEASSNIIWLSCNETLMSVPRAVCAYSMYGQKDFTALVPVVQRYVCIYGHACIDINWITWSM